MSRIIETVPVDLGDRSYTIEIGGGLIQGAGERIAPLLRRPSTFIVSDSDVAAHYLDPLQKALADAGVATQAHIVPAGEASKSFAQLEMLLSAMLDAGVERRDTIIALGGGVVGDLAGFAASILRRGVDFIQVPTTLLAQVDSSVGGKTGIDVPQGKNLIGAFHQPRLVLADLETYKTLPERQRRAGYAEVVKYGLLGNAEFFNWLEGNGQQVLAGEPGALAHAVAVSCRMKAEIVAADERESGQRELLNLGHTFGHAIEAESGYGEELLHGEGVAIGMVLAFNLSARLGLCSAESAGKVQSHLARAGLPTSLAELGRSFDPETLLSHMMQDKKVKDGRITFILVRGIGAAFSTNEVPREDVVGVLTEMVEAA